MKRRSSPHGWARHYEAAPERVMAARLRKTNMRQLAKAIDQRLDTIQGSVTILESGIKWKQSHIGEIDQSIKIGEWLVMNQWVRVMTDMSFKYKYKEAHGMPSYYTPTDNEVKIISLLSNDEYFFGYDYICDETGLTHEQAKEAIDNLRSMGVVLFARGLMNDDGEVCGSGFGIENNLKAEALLFRYYGKGDRE